MNRLAITPVFIHEKPYHAYIMLDENRNFVQFQLFETADSSLINQIFVGRVENIVPSIDAAFIQISPTQKCYLSLKDVKKPIFTKKQSKSSSICIGDELLVQITRDAVKTKDPVCTTKLTLQGKISVLTTENQSLSVSQKMDAKSRILYKQLLSEICSEQFGYIVRTNAIHHDVSVLKEDICALTKQMNDLLTFAKHANALTSVFHPASPFISRLKSEDFSFIDEIVTDDVSIYQEITGEIPAYENKVRLYEDEQISLQTLYGIRSNIDRLLSKTIWLPSGANIIIEQLETLTFIDVNSAKNQSRKSDTMLQVNKEAAVEVARQLRLRNISGMIIVDFINMEKQEEVGDLIEHLKQQLRKDFVPCKFVDITKLGLIEITRKKVFKSLKEMC